MPVRHTLTSLLLGLSCCQAVMAYSGYNACQSFTGLSDDEQASYQSSPFCIPVVNLAHTPLRVSVHTPKHGTQTKVVQEGNVILFTDKTRIRSGTGFTIKVTTKKNKVIYDSSKSDRVADNLYGLMCMRSLTPKEANKTIYVKPKKAKFGPLKCVPWRAIPPKHGAGPS